MACGMNRILFESSEIADGIATCSDARAEHILSVLHGEVGQILKTGELDGKIGTGEIVSINGPTVAIRVSHTEESGFFRSSLRLASAQSSSSAPRR